VERAFAWPGMEGLWRECAWHGTRDRLGAPSQLSECRNNHRMPQRWGRAQQGGCVCKDLSSPAPRARGTERDPPSSASSYCAAARRDSLLCEGPLTHPRPVYSAQREAKPFCAHLAIS
jgi:hypothetical protein